MPRTRTHSKTKRLLRKKSHNVNAKNIKTLSYIVNGMTGAIAFLIFLYAISSIREFSFLTHFAPLTVNVVRNSIVTPPTLNTTLYDQRLLQLANIGAPLPFSRTASTSQSVPKWPVRTVYPNPGAILPFNRVIAYYGNFYSKKMGVLGEYPPQQVLSMLMNEVKKWRIADPTTPVIPAIEYIAVTAQNSPQSDGKYRLRMPKSQIEKAINIAGQVRGLVFLDVQVGLSSLRTEIPLLEPYLRLPQVGLAIDPEFSMKNGKAPGSRIGTFDATDINYASRYLASVVNQYHLPPKILVVHRFTEAMVTNYKKIIPLPEVQIVMDMDGWGSPARKIRAYQDVVYEEPVQFTGVKLFYKNDIRPPSSHILTPLELLKLKPIPIYIQYQ